MSYKYDIFISVKRDDVFNEWLEQHFMPLFQSYIRQEVIVECGRQYEGAFYYKESITSGMQWKAELKSAIESSRCAVALCSPEYFYSQYCCLEWNHFHSRGAEKGIDLIVPASIHDGEAFPEYAREIQRAHLQDFVIVGAGYKKTPRYLEFQESMKAFTKHVARRLRLAPPFGAWPPVDESVLDPAHLPDSGLDDVVIEQGNL